MESPRLNYDTLLHILSFASRSMLIVLGRTCRLLNRYGARRLLEGDIKLNADKKTVSSFWLFLIRDVVDHLPRIHSLVLYMRSETRHQTTAQTKTGLLLKMLFDCLALGNVLHSLRIDNIKDILELHPELPNAISAVASIESLAIEEVGPCSAKMLKALRSGLIDADIVMRDDMLGMHEDEDADFVGEDMDPLFLLHSSQHSLQELSLACAQTALHNPPTYPKVTELSLSNSMDMLRTRQWVKAFPNLRVLSATDCDNTTIASIDDFEEELTLRRRKNRRDQQCHGTWTSLRQYQGPISTLFHLGLLCPIRSVCLDDDEYDLEPKMLREVLEDARPEHLSIYMSGGYQLVDPDFLATFSRPFLNGLAHLELTVSLHDPDDQEPGQEPLSIMKCLDNVVSGIVTPLGSLVSFKLGLAYGSLGSAIYWHLTLDEKPLRPIERALGELDLDTFARRVQEANQSGSLKSITLAVYGLRTRSNQVAQLGPFLDPDDFFLKEDEGTEEGWGT
ncbi:hypothetical protein BV20DRAFT_946460 [Pilatotrama ljubarskyi]|nr:hypothetical protein BV20DRAFT_946460 [Pilatotrama ljubarskyi]